MAEPKKKSIPSASINKSSVGGSESQSPLSDLLSREELDTLSTLQLVDLIVSKLPARHPSILDVVYLRERIAAMEEMNYQAQEALEKLDAIVEKLRSPAFRVGTFIMPVEPVRIYTPVPAEPQTTP